MEDQYWWCLCRRFCRGRRTQLNSKRTWYRHLKEAADDEKEAIRTAHLSEEFRAQVQAASARSTSSNDLPLRRDRQASDEVDEEQPGRPSNRQRIDQPPDEPIEGGGDNSNRDEMNPDRDEMNPDRGDDDNLNRDGPAGFGDEDDWNLAYGDEDYHLNGGEGDNANGRDEADANGRDEADADHGLDGVNQREADPNQQDQGRQAPAQRDNPLADLDLNELKESAKLDTLRRDMEFIQSLRNATLDDGVGLTGDALDRLRNPPQTTPEIEDPVVELALSMFLALEHSSQDTYEKIRRAVEKCFPGSAVPSFYQTKKILAGLTGVHSLVNDMCLKGCVAFTGPYADLEVCPHPDCGESRYDPVKLAHSGGQTKVPRAVFNTIPIGPQLQALHRHPETAQKMRYRDERTREILRELEERDGLVEKYNDVLTGSAYLDAFREGTITTDDTLLVFSIDGAQLYESKQSDCWIYIWIVLEHSPDERYKKKNVLPGAIIPGPNKPKYIESFLYPGFHHLSALQREGLTIWNAFENKLIISHLILFLACGDGPGLLCASNLVGHSGKVGCRMYCSLRGRRKPRGPQYYPVLLLPNEYAVVGCMHDDISPYEILTGTSREYATNLKYLMSSPNPTQFKERRLQTGIVGPSILLGLQPQYILGIPECFSSEIMHYAGANMASLFSDLWRGTIDCERTDNRNEWDWRVLIGEQWEEHGRAVAACKPHLPGCFDIAPRNPAEKINSFYKAKEFITWLYHLCPALLYNVLPQLYWRNFCKFVAALRIMSQHDITPSALEKACQWFGEWEQEFEEIYYQRRVDRIHFVRPCVHLSNHLAYETTRVGAPICSSQWTMERTIGNLGQEIRQPSDPFSNLAQQGIRRCQVNALKALFPQFDPPENHPPRGSEDLGDGYLLLHKRDRRPISGSAREREEMQSFLDKPAPSQFFRWARLRLPNGQTARSAWSETERLQNDIRVSRNVKIKHGNFHRFAEVQYYTQLAVQSDDPDGIEAWRFVDAACVHLYGDPDADLDHLSYGTVKSCRFLGQATLTFIHVKSILSVVGMVPHKVQLPSGVEEEQFFVVDMTGIDITDIAANVDADDDDDDE